MFNRLQKTRFGSHKLLHSLANGQIALCDESNDPPIVLILSAEEKRELTRLLTEMKPK